MLSSGQLFVGSAGSGGSVGEYAGDGSTVTASLISSISYPIAVAVSGSDLFVVNGGNTVSEYTDTGTVVSATLLQLPEVDGIAVSGTHIYVSDSSSGVIGEYNTSGSVVNASLISDTNHPHALAASGSDLFVVDSASDSVGEYTLSGGTVNASLFTAGGAPTGIAVSGSDVFVADDTAGTVGEYTTAGATVHASLISGLTTPQGISIYGSNLYLADSGTGDIGQYTTAGATVNAALVSGLSSPQSVAVVGPASKLVVHAGASSATAGSVLSPAIVIRAEDSNGNVDSLETSSVTIAIASGPSGAVLDGSTNVSLQDGAATFSDLTLSKSGTYTLTATDGSFTAATTSSIAVVAGTATTLAFDQSPTGTTTNTAISPAVTVDVEDAEGNLVTTNTSMVTMAIATGPSGAVLGGATSVAAVGGVATFNNLTLSAAGAYTLAASGSYPTVISGSFTITAPAVNRLAFAQQPVGTTTTSILAPVKVNVQNSSGTLLSGDTSNVTLAIATGPNGAVLGGATTVAAVAGVATFSNLTLTTAGTYTLIATDSGDTSATSTSFTMSVPGVNKVAFATQPQGTTTSTPLAAVKVDVESSSGTLLTGDTSNVALEIATGPSGAALGGTTIVAAVAGVATFSNLTLATAGTYTLKATDGADTSATSTSFTITAPGVNKLAFATQPHTATTSTTLPAVKVHVENSSGTLLASDTSTVTLSIASGPAGAMLGGTVAVAAVGGVATFSTLSFATAGAYTLTATDGSDTAATSVSFTISPPLANKLVFATQPLNATPSTGLGTITIDVENNAGTLLSSDESNVTLTIATGTAGATLGGTTTVAAVNGVATFSDLFITTAGASYTLTASDGTDVPATSSAFSITAPPAVSNLVFVGEPVNTNISSTLGSVSVAVTDTNTGAVITTDTGNVTLSITGSPGGVTLGGTTTVAAVNGVATFTDLTIGKVGSYTLTATETGYTSAASTQFNVYYPPVTVGQLDPVFGSAGLIKSNVGFTSTAGEANDNGQIVVIGTTGTVPTESFSIARYNADGTLDTAFGTNGVTTIHFADTDDVPAAVSVLASGQILIAGTATTYVSGSPTTSQFAVTELNADGSLNTNFGNGTGEVLFGFSSAATHDVLTSMVVSPRGIIYLGGRSDTRSTTGNDFAIVAMDLTGTPYPSFGAGGQVLLDFDNASDTINSLALQNNGDLVAAGSAVVGGVTDIALARLLTTGVPDRHFGTNGEVTTSVGGAFDSATSVAIQPNGRIVIGGISVVNDATTDFVVARYTSNGRLDRSFGGGAVVTSFSGPSAVTQVLIQADGRIVATGKIAPSLTNIVSNQLEVGIARYTTRGALDTAFDGTGTAVVDLSTATFTTSETLSATPPPVDAATLTSEANQLIASKQASAVLNTAGEILAVGNSGANTVEAEVITQGVDLSAAVLTPPPASIAGGTKAFANVQITENAADIARGSVTITLELTTDTRGNGAIAVKTLTQKINLIGGRSHTLRIPFVYPTNLTGNYYLMANVVGDGTAGMRELNQLNNLSPAGSAVAITPPFITLAGSSLLGISSAFTPGRPAQVEFTLTNDGNVIAHGRTAVYLYLSTDQTIADGTLVSSKPFVVALQPGASHAYRQSFMVPAILRAGTYTLIAVVDPLKSLGSTDETNSTVTDPTGVSVG